LRPAFRPDHLSPERQAQRRARSACRAAAKRLPCPKRARRYATAISDGSRKPSPRLGHVA
jgi:hypothetical protein